MIYLGGDTHGRWDNLQTFKTKTTKDDTLIILGDFGLAWNEETFRSGIKFFKHIPATVIAVMGNHENYDMIEELPIVELHGAKMRQCSDNVYYVCNGEIFEVEGKLFYAFGGGKSIDKAYRMQLEMKSRSNGRNVKLWWEQEIPSDKEFEEGMALFDEYKCQVDYILTHEAPNSVMREVGFDLSDEKYIDFMNYLEFAKRPETKWFFGHLHFDKDFAGNKTCLYNTFEKIDPEDES